MHLPLDHAELDHGAHQHHQQQDEGLCAGPAEVAGAVGEGFLVDGVHERGRGTDRAALGEDVDLPVFLKLGNALYMAKSSSKVISVQYVKSKN